MPIKRIKECTNKFITVVKTDGHYRTLVRKVSDQSVLEEKISKTKKGAFIRARKFGQKYLIFRGTYFATIRLGKMKGAKWIRQK
jgi:hypothetical protein